MAQSIKRLVTLISIGLLLILILTVVSQTAQVVSIATTLNPLLGKVVLTGLLTAYALLAILLLWEFLRLPSPLIPPDEGSPAHEAFLGQLGARLKNNPHLTAPSCDNRLGIEAAIRQLDGKAVGVIRQAASSVFVSTAVSQNGRLDAFMVLATQLRMIWQVARIYHQRPALRDLVYLYGNVAATVFVAGELEDLEIGEQVEPVLKAALGASIVGFVPGASALATLVTQSLLEGAANSFLTLRVGVICQMYCGALTVVDRRRARRQATLQAAAMLGSIVTASAAGVIKAMISAARRAGESSFESASSGVREMGTRLNPFKSKGEG